MRRLAEIILLLWVTACGTPLATWVHELLDHASPRGQDVSVGHRSDHGRPHPANHDRQHCGVCVALAAPMTPTVGIHLPVRMSLAAHHFVALRPQRVDVSVPAPRGCRGPPASEPLI